MSSLIQLRISDNDPYVYEQPSTAGSVAIGTDSAESNKFKIVMSDAIGNLDPSSGTISAGSCSLSIDPTVNGNIEFCPKGSGQTNFARGSVAIEGQGSTAGNLLMNNTTASGLSGVIEFGGARVIHNKGTNNNFFGTNAGNFSVSGNNNLGCGNTALLIISSGSSNTCVGTSNGAGITTGQGNSSIGASSLGAGTSASFNTALGATTLGSLTSGQFNIVAGNGSGSAYTGSESSNILINNTGTVSENNTIRIGTQGSLPGQQNRLFAAGINGTSITAAGTVVVSSSGQLGSVSTVPMTWVDTVTNTQQMAVNTGYVSDDGATLVTFTLPATAAIGDSVQVLGKGTGLWTIAQNSGQTIHFGTLNTTTGVTGSLSSTNQYDCVRLRCITANTDWVVTGEVQGNLTVV